MASGPQIVRTVAALLFVGLLATVLTIPLRGSERPSAPQSRVPHGSKTAPSGRTAAPSAARTPLPDRFRFVDRYPRACLRPVSRPGPQGLVAAFARGAVRIATLDGRVQATITKAGGPGGIRPPIAWSPSGRILAVGPQGLFYRPNGAIVPIGDVQHGLVEGRRGVWAWSPISECGLAISEAGALHVVAVNPFVAGVGRILIEKDVGSFAFSPDGTQLGLVVGPLRHRTIVIADLRTGRANVVRRHRFPTCCISLGGWTPDSRYLLYWAATGSSVAADGWPLEGISAEAERISLTPLEGKMSRLAEVTVPRPEALETCGDRLIGVLGGARFGVEPTRLAILYPLSDQAPIGSDGSSDVEPACSANGELLAVARGQPRRHSGVRLPRSLVLLDVSGRGGQAQRVLTPAGGSSEETPEWGPPGTGIVFESRSGDAIELWYLEEGSVDSRPLGVPAIDWWRSWDWSATPPSGLAP